MQDSYQPKPIESAGIQLDRDLIELGELLAESNHDQWARQRLEQGWTWGPERNDEQKTHPGLVPYRLLSETEKNYDRTAVQETLKGIIALGYEIRRRDV